jgi:hypothetical protein
MVKAGCGTTQPEAWVILVAKATQIPRLRTSPDDMAFFSMEKVLMITDYDKAAMD